MKQQQFKKNDEFFVCINCNKKVEKLGYSSRNHCPYCLHSLHIDNLPGDRANTCAGIMKPINVEPSSKKGYIIVFKCLKCNQVKRNVMAKDDSKKAIFEVIESAKFG